MKRTAKSILAALLTLMMLISPLVIVGSAEENAAAATTVVDSFSSIYNIGAGAGTLQDGNDISFGSAAGGINAFPQSTALKSNLNLGGSPRRISLSFTVDTDGTGTLPTIDVRLYPAGNKSGNRSYTLVSLSGSNITVKDQTKGAVKIADYGADPVEIALDCTITKWATEDKESSPGNVLSKEDGTLTYKVYVNGKLQGEYSNLHSIQGTKDYTSVENAINFSGTVHNTTATTTLSDFTVYLDGAPAINVPEPELAVTEPTGINNSVGAWHNTAQLVKVGEKNIFKFSENKNSTVSNPTDVNAYFAGAGLESLSNGAGKTRKFGLSFTVDTEGEGTLPGFTVRLVAATSSSNNNCTLFGLTSAGYVTVGPAGTRVATYANGSVDVYFDCSVTWASADGTNDGKITISAYVDGIFCGEFSANHKVSTSKNSGVEKGMQFLGTVTKGSTAATLLSDVKFYFDGDVRESFIYQGAAMRLNSDLATSGLRFDFGVDKKYFDSLEGATVGAFIVPTDLMAGKSMTSLSDLAAVGAIELSDIGFLEAESDADTYFYRASIINIIEKNYARSFSAIGYVKVGEEIVSWTGTQSRSVYEVAMAATASGKESAVHQTLLKAYLDKVVTLTETAGSYSISETANYTNPYTVTATENGFTITGEGAENIKAIILNGNVYTKNWTTAENSLTVTFSSGS